MLTIRTAENKDRGKVTAIIDQVLTELGLSLDPDGLDSDLADIEQNYTAPGGLFVVVQNDEGKIAGTAGLMRLNEDRCELRKMYFLPEIRGQGWGKSLLDFLIERAARLGFREIQLETNKNFRSAIALYEKVGFEKKEPGSCDVRCDRAYHLGVENYRRPDRVRKLRRL